MATRRPAEAVGLERRTLYRKLERYGEPAERERSPLSRRLFNTRPALSRPPPEIVVGAHDRRCLRWGLNRSVWVPKYDQSDMGRTDRVVRGVVVDESHSRTDRCATIAPHSEEGQRRKRERSTISAEVGARRGSLLVAPSTNVPIPWRQFATCPRHRRRMPAVAFQLSVVRIDLMVQ